MCKDFLECKDYVSQVLVMSPGIGPGKDKKRMSDENAGQSFEAGWRNQDFHLPGINFPFGHELRKNLGLLIFEILLLSQITIHVVKSEILNGKGPFGIDNLPGTFSQHGRVVMLKCEHIVIPVHPGGLAFKERHEGFAFKPIGLPSEKSIRVTCPSHFVESRCQIE